MKTGTTTNPPKMDTMTTSEKDFSVFGSVAPGYESVREMFVQNYRQGRERQSQCCVYVNGEKVVDLWGKMSSCQDQNYDADTLQPVFSNSKTLTSIVFASLVDRGLVSYNDKVAKVWPEFGALGGEDKAQITMADVLRHEAGLASVSFRFPLDALRPENLKLNQVGRLLERETLAFPADADSGSKREYHCFTRGLILNEVFRRTEPEGRTVGEYLRTEVTSKLGADVHIGAGADELARMTRDLEMWSPSYVALTSLLPGFVSQRNCCGFGELRKAIRSNPAMNRADGRTLTPWLAVGQTINQVVDQTDADYLRGELPSANGLASARGLARIAAAMANRGEFRGVRLMSEKTWTKMHEGAVERRDCGYPVTGMRPSNFTQGGINDFSMHPTSSEKKDAPLGSLRDGFFGWLGFGGSVMQWRPDLRLGFGYTCTLLAWYDGANQKAAQLQREAARCAEAAGDKAGDKAGQP